MEMATAACAIFSYRYPVEHSNNVEAAFPDKSLLHSLEELTVVRTLLQSTQFYLVHEVKIPQSCRQPNVPRRTKKWRLLSAPYQGVYSKGTLGDPSSNVDALVLAP